MLRVVILVEIALIALAGLLHGQSTPYPAAMMTSSGVRIWDFGGQGMGHFKIGVHIGTGSRMEEELHHTGLAHFVEHCLFKSTMERSTSERDSAERERGIDHNGWTGPDSTFYWFRGPPTQAEWMVGQVGDMMARPRFDPTDVKQEVNVVIDEIRLRNPQDIKDTLVEGLLYRGHPLARAVGGDRDHIRTFDADDVRAFHRTHYRAENMIVAFRGSGSREDLLQWIEAAFKDVRTGGTMKPGVVQPRAWSGERLLTGLSMAQGTLITGYHIRKRDPRTLAALWILESAIPPRLFKEIRTKRALAYDGGSADVVARVNAWRLELRIQAGSREPIEEIRRIFAQTLDQMAHLDDEEFQTTRRNVIRQIRGSKLDDVVGKTWQLMLTGSSPPDPIRELKALTVDDVREVAEREFRSDHQFVLTNDLAALTATGIPPWIPIIGTLLVVLLVLDAFFGFRYARRIVRKPTQYVRCGLSRAEERREERRERRDRRHAVDKLESEIQGWYDRQEHEETP